MTWLIIGIILLIWGIYDLIVGSVWSYRKIYRKYEPIMYWLVLSGWFILAICCIIPYFYWFM
ncbi:MAG: hypothetical protein N4A62_03180 [Marinisporobacter sp.]|jgi:hypothetical protein|nr:hypothetical protein [Marinisporobacter sp.]